MQSNLERVYKEQYGRILATLIRVCGDFSRAEDALQDAFLAAAAQWRERPLPASPGAWLTTVARNKLIDRLRRDSRVEGSERLENVAIQQELATMDEILRSMEIPDDRLRLIFTCCHPALDAQAQVALTLRTLGGLSTGEIARAFLISETTLAQRIVRAKNKIRVAKIPYEVPGQADIGPRLHAVLRVVYLIFNEGYLAAHGEQLVREDLCADAIWLGRMLRRLLPREPEPGGLLALMLLHHSRSKARVNEAGELLTLEEQSREKWDKQMIEEGAQELEAALAMRRVGPYQLQAAIAALHANSPSAEATDWAQIAMLYRELERLEPTLVVALNRAVASAMAWGAQAGLGMLATLNRDGAMDNHALYHAAVADLLRRDGRHHDALPGYRRALELTHNEAERRYLERRIRELPMDQTI